MLDIFLCFRLWYINTYLNHIIQFNRYRSCKQFFSLFLSYHLSAFREESAFDENEGNPDEEDDDLEPFIS